MKITRRFTKPGQDVFSHRRVREAHQPHHQPRRLGRVRDERRGDPQAVEPARHRHHGEQVLPQGRRAAGGRERSAAARRDGNVVTGPEKSAKQVIHRLAGCWRHWGEKHGYFDTAEDAQAFYDELAYMLLHQMCAPNCPQWFNTGLNWAYGITGPAQGHFYCDPEDRRDDASRKDAYTHPQPHACFIQSVNDDLVNDGGIMDLWTREARLFKYGSGTGSNFSQAARRKRTALRRRQIVGADELPQDRRPRRRRDQVRRHHPPRREDGLPRSRSPRRRSSSSTGKCAKS